jgi:perosamine synthetase
MTRPVPFARPDITEEEIDAVVRVLRSGWLTTGPEVQRFEREFAGRIGAKHAVALNSGTAALHLALEAIDIGPQDEVIVPTWTFTASAEVVRYFGAKPVIVDVNADDLNIDTEAVDRALTPRTKAIIGVDIGGQPAAWDVLRGLAAPNSITLVDDAAHALPAMLKGRLIGTWADLTAFSFYVTKTMATGEGGMLVTANDAWAERARVMSLHGISHDAWKRYTAEGSWRYEVVAPGYKYNMTDLAAALGSAQLARLDTMNARRAGIARRYTDAFAEDPALEPPVVRTERTTAWQLYILRLRLEALTVDRAAFIEALKQRGIGTSVHFIPLHLHPYWRDAYGLRPGSFPVASREFERVISLPIYSAMSDEDATAVIEAVREVARANRR